MSRSKVQCRKSRKLWALHVGSGAGCPILLKDSGSALICLGQIVVHTRVGYNRHFRWKKLTPTIDGQTPDSTAPTLVGVAKNRAWKLMREDAGRVSYEVLARFPTESSSEGKAGSIGDGDSETDDVVLRDYFQVSTQLLYRKKQFQGALNELLLSF